MPKGSSQKERASVSQRKNRGFYSIHILRRCTKWMQTL
nr:MAG TPA: hypothetical protein [Caudoviricetes sp.]